MEPRPRSESRSLWSLLAQRLAAPARFMRKQAGAGRVAWGRTKSGWFPQPLRPSPSISQEEKDSKSDRFGGREQWVRQRHRDRLVAKPTGAALTFSPSVFQ